MIGVFLLQRVVELEEWNVVVVFFSISTGAKRCFESPSNQSLSDICGKCFWNLGGY